MGLCLKTCVLLAVVCASAAGSSTDAAASNRDKWWIRHDKSVNALPQAGHRTADTPPVLATTHKEKLAPASSSPKSHLGKINELISQCGYEFAQLRTNHFHIMYRDRGCPDGIVTVTGDMLERAYREFYEEFGQAGFVLRTSSDALPWVIFDQQEQYRDFARVADGMDSPYLESYYSARTNQVVLMQIATSMSPRHEWCTPRTVMANAGELAGMDKQASEYSSDDSGMLDVRRAVHEAAHQLAFNSGLQKRGVMYPMWVSEGLATNFEADSVHAIGLDKGNAPRLRQLMRAYSGGRLMPLREFATMVQIAPEQARSANDLYAEAWALFNFMFKTRPTQLRAYMSALGEQEPGPKDVQQLYAEFTAAFGSMTRLETAWETYLRSLQE